MNLQEIAKKYPKGYEQFDNYLYKNYGTTVQQIDDEELNAMHSNLIINGLLTEFFDEQQLFISVIYDKFGERNFYLTITDEKTENLDDYYIEIAEDFTERQQAFESGIEKCFEIYERQLGDSKMKEMIEKKIKDFQGTLTVWDIETGSVIERAITEKLSSSLQESYNKAIADCVALITDLDGNRIKLGYHQLETEYWTDKIKQQLLKLKGE